MNRLTIVYDCLFPFTTGGGERQYRAFAESAHRQGRQVEYLTSTQWPGERPTAAGFDIAPITGRLELYDKAGVRRTGPALRFAFGVFKSLLRRRRSTDAVLVSGLPVFNVFAARAALLGSRVPLAVDYLEVWGLEQWRSYAGRAIGTCAWILQRLAIAITPIATCHSQLSARRLRDEGLRAPLLVSPGLIDATNLTEELPLPADDPPYVLYAGRHIADKRVEALPAAVAWARRTVPDLRLVILGTGPSRDAVEAAVAAERGETWTEMPGFVDDETLTRLRSRAACLANPSRREGYGLVVVESAASGTPVVLVQDEGNASTELLADGVNGHLAPSVAPEDLGKAIVAAVSGGSDLRHSTREWYAEAVRTRTIDLTMAAILNALDTKSRTRRGAGASTRKDSL